MILPINPRRTPSGSRVESGRHRANKTTVAVETLEGRELLSVAAHAIVPRGWSTPIVYRGPSPGPIHNVLGAGFAVKVPRLYPGYFGNKLAILNSGAMMALVSPNGQSLLLSGEMATNAATPKIPTQSPAGSAYYYSWAINRGGATAPGVFPGRPNITFDALVIVGITPSGVVAGIEDLKSNTFTPLPSSSVVIYQDTIHVTAPLSALPSTGFNPAQYQVDLFTSDAPPSDNFKDVASFIPEFRPITVKQATQFPPYFAP